MKKSLKRILDVDIIIAEISLFSDDGNEILTMSLPIQSVSPSVAFNFFSALNVKFLIVTWKSNSEKIFYSGIYKADLMARNLVIEFEDNPLQGKNYQRFLLLDDDCLTICHKDETGRVVVEQNVDTSPPECELSKFLSPIMRVELSAFQALELPNDICIKLVEKGILSPCHSYDGSGTVCYMECRNPISICNNAFSE